MSKFKSLHLVEELAEKLISETDCEFVDCDLKKIQGNLTLTIYINKMGGVSLDDCEKISKLLDQPLDELDVTNGEGYYLNVSSPGLDRPLLKDNDFKRNLNNEIVVKLYKAVNGTKEYVGTLLSYSETAFTILVNDEKMEFQKQAVAKATPVIKF